VLFERGEIPAVEIVVEPVELLTERLRLRTPQIDDADAIQSIVADPRVALTTASIPHPYPENGAKGFVLHVQKVASRDRRNLAIILRDGNELIGMVGYQTRDMEAELAYMVSPIHWGLGYASEACREIIAHIFSATEAEAVIARAMADNKASEAVLRKAGLRRQSEMPVELPVRSGTFLTSFWRLSREEFQSL
jgi:RimJ/RimL family protein N-acetyltransferase